MMNLNTGSYGEDILRIRLVLSNLFDYERISEISCTLNYLSTFLFKDLNEGILKLFLLKK